MELGMQDESKTGREELELLPPGWGQFKNVSVKRTPSRNSSRSFRSILFHSDSFRKEKRRAVFKNGDCNIIKKNMNIRRLKFLQDFYTTLVDTKWRWTFFVFTLSHLGLWLSFGGLWYLIVWAHGDLEEDHLPQDQEDNDWKPCITNVDSYASCFLFSIETQFTIGYGLRVITEECEEAIFIMCCQCILSTILTTYTVGVVFAKMTRPKHRTQTLLFSETAVICQRDGELCFMFRVGDIGKSNIIGASVRAQLIKSHTTKEGEIIPQHQTELALTTDSCESELFFIWPMTMVHIINSDSPLYRSNILPEKFEIVVILEGTIESTGQSTQARSSYMSHEIIWGHRFVPMVRYNRRRQGFDVDYSKFEETVAVPMPVLPGKILDELFALDSESDEDGNSEDITLQLSEIRAGTMGEDVGVTI